MSGETEKKLSRDFSFCASEYSVEPMRKRKDFQNNRFPKKYILKDPLRFLARNYMPHSAKSLGAKSILMKSQKREGEQ